MAESTEIDIGSDQEDEKDQDNLADLDLEIYGWKRFLLLPFEPMWSYGLLMLGAFQIFSTIFEVGTTKKSPKFDFTYVSRWINLVYFVDIVATVVCKNVHGLGISPLEIRRPNWILLADFLSIIPVKGFFSVTHLVSKETEAVIKNEINVLNCLKVFRVLHVFYQHHSMVGNSKLLLQVCEFYFCIFFAVIIGFIPTYRTTPGDTTYLDDFYKALSRITGRGFTDYPDDSLWRMGISILGLIVWVGVVSTSIAYFVIASLTLLHHKYNFINKLRLMHSDLRSLKIPKDIVNQCMDYFDNYWKQRMGYKDNPKYFKKLPAIFQQELALDIMWPALKHSLLFRDLSVPLLLHISTLFKSEFVLPGTRIFERSVPKAKMVYVVSGVIQVLSEEDDETAILSFSSGTCLGETSLVMQCEAKATVCCKTYCNLHVLEAKDFIKVLECYPEQYTLIRRKVKERVEKAKRYRDMAHIFNRERGSFDRLDSLTVMWCKSTLHRLMAKDEETSVKHQCQNVFLRDEYNEDKYANKYFTAEFLELLAISERLQLVTDTVFLKNSCPCILQPESIILSGWDGLVVVVAVGAAIVIPYTAFILSYVPLWYKIWIYTVTFIWILDIYIQISTAIKLPDQVLATVKQILWYNMTHFSFLIDLVAAFPLELLSSILIPEANHRNRILLHFNRIIKIWKIELIFRKFENRLNANMLQIRYFKYFLLFSYTTYILACAMYEYEYYDGDTDDIHLIWCLVAVSNILSGVNVQTSVPQSKDFPYYLYMVCIIISTSFYVLIYSSIAAEKTLKVSSKINLQEKVKDILEIIRLSHLHRKFNNRIIRYVEAQWQDNNANLLLFDARPFEDLPTHVYGMIKDATISELLNQVPFFQDLPDEIIYEISLISKQLLLPPNEIVCYTGVTCSSIFIIQEGYCEIVSRKTVLGPLSALSVIETCLGTPVVNTIKTVTHCRLVVIEFGSLCKILQTRRVSFKQNLKNAADGLDATNMLYMLSQSAENELNYTQTTGAEQSKSFRKFGYNIAIDSFQEYDYYVPFDRLDLFSFVQYFLMRSTILPEGKFLFRWQAGRCVCAVLSGILFPLKDIGTCVDCWWFYILIALDAMAWADIYIRLHVCYYDSNGVLISHPLKTAKHYITGGGILVDLFTVFPMHFCFKTANRPGNWKLSILQLNRVLQINRCIGFFDYIENAAFLPSSIGSMIKYFPILLVLCVSSGTILASVECVVSNTAIVNGSETIKWICQNQFHGIYVSTSILTITGTLGFTISTNYNLWGYLFLNFVSFFLACHMLSIAITRHTTNNSALLSYQDEMNTVRVFMNQHKVSPHLQRNLISHYELKWSRKRGRDINDSISSFHHSLQKDILYDIYGKPLQTTLVFLGNKTAFLRSLLVEISHDIHLKDSCIVKLNDIKSELFIIYKGTVNVFTADGAKLTTLATGSIFGNLDNCDMSRQMIEVVAAGHVETLAINAIRFHSILESYPKLKKTYQEYIYLHKDYLKGKEEFTSESRSTVDDVDSMPKSGLDQKRKTRLNVFSQIMFEPNSIFMKIWKFINLFVVCYIGLGCDMFQLAMMEFRIEFVAFQYTCDLLFLINFIIKINTPFENEIGEVVRDFKQIKRRFRRERVMYWCTILSMIPFDLVSWFLPSSAFNIAHPILRMNRLLRFIYFIYYFREESQKLAINLYALRFWHITLWLTLLLHFFTCSVVTLGCHLTPNMHPVINCTQISESMENKVEAYITYFYFIVSCFTHTSQGSIYPVADSMIFYCTLLMIFFEIMRTIIKAQIYLTLQMGYHWLNNYSQYLERIRIFMEREQVSQSLSQKVYNYLRLLCRWEGGARYPLLLKEAPPVLRESIVNAAFGHLIKDHPIFRYCHEDFLRQVAAKVYTRAFFKNDNIVNKGTLLECIIFIQSGAVAVIDEDDLHHEYCVTTLRKGMCFGVTHGLRPRVPHIYSFRAMKSTCLVVLMLKDWEYLLKFFPASNKMIEDSFAKYVDEFAPKEFA